MKSDVKNVSKFVVNTISENLYWRSNVQFPTLNLKTWQRQGPIMKAATAHD